ncbi:MAG TPA: sigma-70 family RNA polymerase sigma factor [Actinomycetota bacterium]|nr:sigma-70 family RNA polymerase sigma factor [Actinomycetota bacterium]
METAVRIGQGGGRFAELYAAHGRDAVRLGYLLTGNAADAEDLAQEAFVRLLGKFADLRKPESFRTYLMRTVTNLARGRARRRDVERRHAGTLAANAGGIVEPPDLGPRYELAAALDRLPYRQRAALVLRYCEDLSEQQTAEVLDTSVKAVKGLVARGLASLRGQEVRR